MAETEVASGVTSSQPSTAGRGVLFLGLSVIGLMFAGLFTFAPTPAPRPHETDMVLSVTRHNAVVVSNFDSSAAAYKTRTRFVRLLVEGTSQERITLVPEPCGMPQNGEQVVIELIVTNSRQGFLEPDLESRVKDSWSRVLCEGGSNVREPL